MKKIALYTLLVAISLTASAQLTRLDTPREDLQWTDSYDAKYYYGLSNNTVYLYSWDFSLYKTIATNPPSGYKISSCSILGKRYINNDDKVELFVSFMETTSDDNTNNNYTAKLINEDGDVIENFGIACILNLWQMYSLNNETRLCIYKVMINSSTGTSETSYIHYLCGGPGTVSVPPTEQCGTNIGSAYPNPGSSLITIPYHLASEKAAELHIFNSNGTLVRSIPVGPHFDKVTIDVSNLQPGVYIYECEGKTNKFVVQ
ncbi:MAG: T9SS type A sorting domain-containing protein [Bacteroidales bacterium]|nr:T9SS type A sorting domain-containing protein [Bacteroidales bacterium]